ncbi:MAG: hypothetical protein OXB98_18755 [Bryobacterales bacterium]|nr:hypothetical protein [Bryobacterales bacterium]
MDRIILKGFEVLVGDANGADKAVQRYFKDRGYSNVHVFCMSGRCRNNLGNWPAEEVPAPKGMTGRNLYAIKDRVMTERSSIGFMLWDGESAGTLANVLRLLDQKKTVVVYHSKSRESLTLENSQDLDKLLARSTPEVRRQVALQSSANEKEAIRNTNIEMFDIPKQPSSGA